MKKKMYYTMRIKTIQRNFSTLKKCIKAAKKNKIEQTQIQRLLYPHVYKTTTLQFLLHENKLYEDLKKKISDTINFSINRLLIELDTGGNIRLEEGKGNEKWFISCVDLIKSRFFPEEMQTKFDVTDINVNRVIRIHNRFLRNKFEEKMESLVESNNGNYKKSLEYLFFGFDPAYPSNVSHVIEEGFPVCSEAKTKGFCSYPALVNSILAADCPRLYDLMKKNLSNKENVTFVNSLKFDQKLMIIPPGVLVICKVLMLKNSCDNKYPKFDLEKTPNEITNIQPIDKNFNV